MATAKYAIISSATPLSDLLDLDLNFGSITLNGQDIQYVGSEQADAVFLRPGVTIDFTTAGSGIDKLYLAGNFSDYKLDMSGGFGVLERTVDGKLEKATFGSGDVLVFADGFLSTVTLINYIKSTKATLPPTVPPVPPVLDTSEKSSAPAVAAAQSASVKMAALAEDGVTFAAGSVGVELVLVGSAGVDTVYIKAGTKVDASTLGSGQDKIYFTGNYADYSKSLNGSLLTLERTVNGNLERVMLGASDKAIFADGSVPTLDIRNNLTATTPPNWDASETTPGLSDIASISVDGTGGANNFYKANDTITFSVTMKSPVTVTTTGGSPTLEVNVGGKTVQAVFDSANSTGSVLKFKYVVAAGDADANGVSVAAGTPTGSAIQLNGANINLTAGNQAAKLTQNPAVADSGNHKVDAVVPEVTAVTITGADSAGAAKTGILSKGDKIIVTLKAGEVVFVAGTPEYTLEIGGKAKKAQYVSGSGTDTLVFEYVVVQGDSDINGGLTAGAAALTVATNASIKDAAGNPAKLTVPAVVANTNKITIDAVPPETGSGMEFKSVSSGPGDATPFDSVTNQSSGDIKFSYTGLNLAAGERFQYSYDGVNWVDISADNVNSADKTISINNQSFQTSPTIQIRAIDAAGNVGPVLVSQAITYSAKAPSLPAITTLSLSDDTGASATDFITKTKLQTINAKLSGTLGAGEKLFGSFDGGKTFADLSSFITTSDNTTTLKWTGVSLDAGSIQFKVRNAVGNESSVFSKNYTLDTTTGNDPKFLRLESGATLQQNDVLQGAGAEAGAKVELLSDNVVIATTTADADGLFSFILPAQTAGPHTLKLSYTDLAGNVSTPSADGKSVTWGSTPSKVAPLAPAGFALSAATDSGSSQSDGITNVATATLTGSGAVPGATIEVSVKTADGNYIPSAKTVTVAADGTWSYVLSDAGPLSADAYFVVRQQADGVWSPLSSQYRVQFDNTVVAPTLKAQAGYDTGDSSSDGITKLDSYTFSGEAEAGASVEVFDNGVKIATAIADSKGAWETKLANVSAGKHNYTAQQTDVAGNTSAKAELTITVDRSAAKLALPVLDVASNSGSTTDNITDTKRPTLTGSKAEAGATIQVFDNLTKIGSTVVAADGSWSFAGYAADLSLGEHSFTVTQTDVAGNVSTASEALKITIIAPVNLTAPSAPMLAAISDSGESNSDGITNATSLQFNGTGAIAGGKVEVWQGKVKLGEVATTTAGAWSITLTNIAEGANQKLTARVVDSLGHSSAFSPETTIAVDRSGASNVLTLNPLSVTDDTGRLNTDGITKTPNPVISGTGAPANAKVNIYNGNVLLTTLTADATGHFSGQVTLATNATYALSAVNVDVAGNESGRSASLSVTVDTTVAVPVITTSATDRAAFNGNPTLQGTGEAGALVELFAGSATTPVASGYVNANGTWSIQYPQTATGQYQLSVRQTDIAGNVSDASAPVSASIGTGTPAPAVTPTLQAPSFKAGEDTGASATDGITQKASPVLVINGVDSSITAANANTSLKMFDGTTQVSGTFAPGATAGSWEFTPANPLSNGSHNLNVKQTVNGAESSASNSLAVTVDTTSPNATTVGVARVPSSGLGFGSARYIMIRSVGSGGYLDINEVQVMSNGVNVALNKLVLVGPQGTDTSYGPASNMVDGNKATLYDSNIVTSDAWVQIDLGQNYPVDSIIVTPRTGFEKRLVNSYIIASPSDMSTTTATDLLAGKAVDIHVVQLPATLTGDQTLISSSAYTSISTYTQQPLLSGTGEPGATVELTDTVNGVATVLGTAKVAADGTWSFQTTTITSGSHSITVKQTDVAGNISTVSTAYSFTFAQATAPVVPSVPTLMAASDTGSNASDGITNLSSVAIQGTGVANETIEVYKDNGAAGYQLLGTVNVNSSGTWVLAGVALTANASNNIVVRAKNAAGTSDYSPVLKVVHDSTAPTAPTASLEAGSDTSVAGDNLTNKSAIGEVKLTGTAEAGASISIKSGTTEIGNATVAVDGTWTATLTAALTSNAANNLTITATDKAGNVSSATAYTVTHDNVAPSTSLTLTSGTQYSKLPTLQGSGAEAGAFVDIYNGAKLLASTQADSTGNWSVKLAGLTNSGDYSIKAVQRDAAGNVSSTQTTFNITVNANAPSTDNVAPALTNVHVLAADDNGSSVSDGITTIRQARLTGTGAVKNAIIKIWEGNTLIGTTAADAAGAWTFTPANNWSAGVHTLSVSQESAGMTASAGFSYTLNVVDSLAAPVITTIAGDPYANNVSITAGEVNGGIATVAGTAIKGATVTVTFSNSKGTVISKTATVNNDGSWTSPSLAAADIVTLGTGSINIQAKQSLGGFNSVLSSAKAAIIDANSFVPPAPVTINANIATDNVISASERPTISGTATAGAAVQVTLTNTVTNASVTLTAVTNASGNWATDALTSEQVSTLGGDSQALRVDVAQTTSDGKISTESRDIQIDTVGPSNLPTISLASASDSGANNADGITNVVKPTFSGKADANAQVNVYQGTTLLGNSQADANGNWSLQVPATLADGNYSFTAKQLDAAGNESAASVAAAVTVDTAVTAPAAPTAMVVRVPSSGPGFGSARYIMIRSVGSTEYLDINEVQVMSNGVNVALNKLVLVGPQGTDTSYGPASNMVDGNKATLYDSNIVTSDAWVQIDLGQNFPVDSIIVTPRPGRESRIKNAYIVASPSDMSTTTATDLLAGKAVDMHIVQLPATLTGDQTFTTSTAYTPVYSAQPLLAGTGEAGATIELTDTVGGVVTPLGSVKVAADGTWRFKATEITSGSHSITAKQTDVAGNVSTISTALTFTVDTSKLSQPDLDAASDSGLQGDGVTNITTPILKGAGATAGAKLDIYDGSVKLGQVTADSNGQWTYTVPAALASGTHSIVAKELAADGSVVKTSAISSLLIDTTAAAPVVNAITPHVKSAPIVTGTAEANATITLVVISNDSPSKTFTFTTTANGSGAWSINTGTGSTPLDANKLYTVRASQVDTAGNSSAQSAVQTLNYDTEVKPPEINAITGTQAATFTVTGSGGEPGATVRVFDGKVLLGSTTVDAQGKWSLVVKGLSNGAHTLNAEQIDLAGNLSTQVKQSVTVDATLLSAPVLAAASDSGVKGDGITNVSNPGLSGVAAANATVEVWDSFNGSSIKVGTATADSKGNWSLTLTGQAEGDHSYVSKEVAADGVTVMRTSTTGLTLTTNTTTPDNTPTLSSTTDSNSGANKADGITNVTTPTFSGKADANAVVNVYQGTTLVGNSQADANGNWSLKVPAALADGNYSFTAKQLDAAGNESAASVAAAVTVDTAVTTPTAMIVRVPSSGPGFGSARYIMIRSVGSGEYLDINEVQVMSNGVNVALKKAVLVGPQGTDTSYGPADNMVDGNKATLYDSNIVTSDAWVQIDLGQNYPVDSIIVTPRTGFEKRLVKSYIIASPSDMTTTTATDLLAGKAVDIHIVQLPAILSGDQTLTTSTAYTLVYSAQPLLTGTGEAGATIELTDTVGGVVTPLGSVKVAADGTWRFKATEITSGSHSITIKQTDVAGNESTMSKALTFTVDSSKLGLPVLDVASDSGQKGDGVTNITTPTLKGAGATAGAKLDIYDGSVKLGQVTADANGLWTYTVPAALASGTHNIVAKELAADGSVAKTSGFILEIDTTTAAAPLVNTITTNVKSAPVVTGTAEANATVTLVATSNDTPSKTFTFTTTANSSGAWSINTGTGSTPLDANKGYTVRASQVDAAGNSSAQSAVQTLNYDTDVKPPEVNAITGTQAATFTVTGTGEAGATVRVFDGKVLLGSATVDTQGKWSLVVKGLSNGAHTLNAEQIDLAGSLSTQAKQSVTVDVSVLSAPVLAVASDSGVKGDGITNLSNPGLSGSGALANARVQIFEGNRLLGETVADSRGNWSLSLSSPLSEGIHNLQVKELGADGVSVARTSKDGTINIDTSNPAILAAPTLDAAGDSGVSASDAITRLRNQVVRGKAEPLATVNLLDNGTVIGTTVANIAGEWSLAVVLAAGNHVLTSTQTDVAGNVSPVSNATKLLVDEVVAAPTANLPLTAVGSQPIINGQAEAFATVTISYEGGKVEVQADAFGNWRAQLLLDPDIRTRYPLAVTQTDVAGNVSSVSNFSLVVSPSLPGTPTAPPTLSAPVIASGQDTGKSSSDGLSNNNSPVINGQGAVPKATVELWANGQKVASTIAGDDGKYSFTAANYNALLRDGLQNLTVVQVVNGVSSQDSATVQWTVDTITRFSIPKFELTAEFVTDAQGQTYTNTDKPTISGKAEAGAEVRLYDNGNLWQIVTADALGRWSVTATLPDATMHAITTQVADSAGNLSAISSAIAFKVLNTPPAAPVARLVAGGDSGSNTTDGITNVTNQWITGTVTVTQGMAAPLVKIFDNGVLIGSVQAAADGAWTFNIANMSNGGHVISVRAVDIVGNLSSSQQVAVLNIDTLAPGVLPAATLSATEDTGKSQTDGLTSKSRPALTGKAEPGSAVELYVDGVLVATENTIDAQGAFSIKPVQALSDGAHQLTLVQVDMAGNRSQLSSAKSIIVDTVINAPGDLTLATADVLYYKAGTAVTRKPRPEVKGFGEAGATVEVFSGSVSLGTTVVNGDGLWSLQLNADLSANNTLYAVQTDAAGNRSANSANLSIVHDVNAALPPITLQAASDTGTLGDGITANTRPVLTGAGAQDGDTIELFNGTTRVGTAVANSAGGWAVQPSLALLDGIYTLTVKNTSRNTSLGELQVKILATPGSMLINLALAASADSGTAGDNITNMDSPVIEGNGAEPGALIRLLEGTTVVGEGRADANGAWSIKTIALSDGAHQLVAVQVNAAGIVSPASGSLAVTIDSVAPAKLAAPTLAAADDSAITGGGVTNHTSVSVSGIAAAGAIVNLYNGTQFVMSVRAQLDGSWSARLENLVQGSYSLSATQTDAAGNVSAKGDVLSLQVDLIAAAPTIALSVSQRLSKTDDTYTISTAPTFVGKAEAGATVKVYDGSLLLGTAIANATGDWSVTSGSQLSIGTHGNIYAVQTDVAGNQSNGSANLAVTIVPDNSVPRSYKFPAGVGGRKSWSTYSLADINGDGNIDLMVPPSTPASKDFVALGDGSGAFTETTTNARFSTGIYSGASSIYVDLNGDGYADLLALSNTGLAGLEQSTQTGYWMYRGAVNKMANVATAADAYLPSTANTGFSGFNFIGRLTDLNGDGHVDFTYYYGDGRLRVGVMLSTGSGVWRSVRGDDVLGSAYIGSTIAANADSTRTVDVNNDGLADIIVRNDTSTTIYLNTGNGYIKDQVLAYFGSYFVYDANNDGYFDLVGGSTIMFGGESGFKAADFGTPTALFTGSYAGQTGIIGADVGGKTGVYLADINGDGHMDYLRKNQNGEIMVMQYVSPGVYQDVAAMLDWRRVAGSIPDVDGQVNGLWKLVDVNNDRALDLVVVGDGFDGDYGGMAFNPNRIEENTYLQVLVSNDRGGKNAYGAVVKLYDSTGKLVDMKLVDNDSNSAVSFYGLKPNQTYDVVVIYPGNGKSVTVVTGKAGLGVDKINPAALNQIVDSSLTSVSPGGKDVIWVAREDRNVSTNGGVWLGTGLADQMVGDKGDDVFMPNGARAGEAGDTLTGGGGHDRFVFNVKANLNTAATITDFSAKVGAESDSIDLGQLLTVLGYTGDRTVSALSSWVKVTDNGTDTIVSVDAHSGANGASSGFVNLVTLKGVKGESLDDLANNGFIHLGGVKLDGIVADQTVTETASIFGVKLAATAALAAEGGKFAAGFNGGRLLVTLENASSSDSLTFANVNNVSYNANTGDVMISDVKVAKLDAGMNGIGAGGKLLLNFDFSTAGAPYASAEQQAGAVQAILQSLTLTSTTFAPTALDREITFTLTDALGAVAESKSGLRITPLANTGTLDGVNYVTGTESVETLTGTAAHETFVGYNGQPTSANTANLNTAKTFGDTLTGGGGNDTFKWLKSQLMNSDAGDKITDFGLKTGKGGGQGAAEADVIDLSAMLVGFNANSKLSDFVRAVLNVNNGKVEIQVDHDGKANGPGFDKSWFVTMENMEVHVNNQVVINGQLMDTTVAGLTGNVTVDNLIEQMRVDNQFKVLP
jgi:large repetitive protein